MAALTVYSADSSALIHGWRRIYRPKNFGFVWDQLGALIEEGRLKASIEVYNDFEKKDDELFKWCKDRKGKLVVDIDAPIQVHVAKIMKVCPRLVDTVKGRSGSDPFVVALAATTNPPMTVVTEEFVGKYGSPTYAMLRKCPTADWPTWSSARTGNFGETRMKSYFRTRPADDARQHARAGRRRNPCCGIATRRRYLLPPSRFPLSRAESRM
jgi:hypothetical protein